MKKITVDFNILDTKEKLYDFISEQLEFPDWFGRNADALHDCISEINDTVEIAVKGSGDWTKPIIAALRDAENVRLLHEPHIRQ